MKEKSDFQKNAEQNWFVRFAPDIFKGSIRALEVLVLSGIAFAILQYTNENDVGTIFDRLILTITFWILVSVAGGLGTFILLFPVMVRLERWINLDKFPNQVPVAVFFTAIACVVIVPVILYILNIVSPNIAEFFLAGTS